LLCATNLSDYKHFISKHLSSEDHKAL